MSTVTPTPSASVETNIFGLPLTVLLEIIIIVIVAIAIERLITTYLSRFAKRTKLEANVANNLALIFRIIIFASAIAAISAVGGFSAEWIVSLSAIVAAAVGFASQKTIGNFVAGIFLIAARPFKVSDYVRIGTIEGIVVQISVNYTKILTSANSVVSISNLQILDREITNYLYETPDHKELYCYTFEMGFDHSVSEERMDQIFNQVFSQYAAELPIKPCYVLTRSTAGERTYTVYLYVASAEQIFKIRPKIAGKIYELWAQERRR
ncbi:MAG: mechanosensitive ion channel family protein [Methanocella sp.]|jgi:hypothetical protein